MPTNSDMAVFQDMSTSPRPGRRNALPNIFEGVSSQMLERLRHGGGMEGEDGPREGDMPMPEAPVVGGQENASRSGSPSSNYLDIIHSTRYRQRRNAVGNVAETFDRQTLREQLNNFHFNHESNDSDSESAAC